MKTIIIALAIISSLTLTAFAQTSDATLRSVIEKDRSSRSADGKLVTLTVSEHLARGKAYLDNRHFPESRKHFQKIIDNYSSDPAMSYALFGMGRSLMWEREYSKAIVWFDRAATEFPATKDGRESLAFKGACNVRLGRNIEAAQAYEQYTVMYPTGERIDSAYLNIIDALREAKKYDDASAWVDKARTRFSGTATETNALDCRLRMENYRGNWPAAIAAADLLLSLNRFADSMVSADEVKYLKANALERSGKKSDANMLFSSLSQNSTYYGGLAYDRVTSGTKPKPVSVRAADYPVPFRIEVLEYARKKKIDPRFILAIMKQESSFRPSAKSGSAARGLLQLVMDTALKYNKKAGYNVLQPDDLYNPRINIAIGTEYIADLKDQFDGLYEAIAASYNGGEDNAARWLARTKPKDAGIFASEIGFAESKNYVFKVMNNYRAYQYLYDESLNKR